ncbi:MAG: lysylphosphatidylglycerol synthase transmembrane domain-containing protein [Acidimicrobiales bacterium]|nr:lysylphosphatidylglycerol synthase transmembrane domain-containing protein [Acidimicrobiales bacterium]
MSASHDETPDGADVEVRRRDPRTRRRARIVTAVGLAFAAGGLAFVLQRIGETWDETGPLLRNADPGWLTGALVVAALGMTAIAVPWVRVVDVMGGRLTPRRAIVLYYVGEIGKYLPGGIWPVVGRGELAARTGMRRTVAYSSVLFSLAALYLAALLLAAGLLPFVLASGGSSPAPALLLLLVPLGLALLHPTVLGAILSVVQRVTRRELDLELQPWPTMVGLVVIYVPAWLLIGTATWAVTEALSSPVGWVEICFATTLSWSAGFLVAPAPGGVGIREAVFVAVAASLTSGVAAAVALCARLLFMVVDAVGAAVCSLLLGTPRRTIRDRGRGPGLDRSS